MTNLLKFEKSPMSASTLSRKVAIVGMWCRVPGADSPAQFWENVVAGRESIRTLSKEELAAAGIERSVIEDPSFVQRAGVLEGADLFDAKHFRIPPAEAILMDPQHRQFLECAWHALADAGYGIRAPALRVGVFASQSGNGYRAACATSEPTERVREFTADIVNGAGHLATRVAYCLDLRGPAVTVQSACSSSLVAVHLACQSLSSRECDIAIAGGVAIRWPQSMGHVYVEGGIMSRDGTCRPFDAEASGTVRGDGVGVVVLRRLDDAVRARDAVRAVIVGTAVNNDGRHRLGFTAPSAMGQAEVIRSALANAGIEGSSIGYVETHGTATLLGDRVELSAIREALGPKASGSNRWVGAVKANIGHLDAASGVVGLINATHVVSSGWVPPLLNFRKLHEEVDANNVGVDFPVEGMCWKPRGARIASVSSFGLGGTNAHVVIEEAAAGEPVPSPRSLQLVLLSAATHQGVTKLAERLILDLELSAEVNLPDIAYTLGVGRQHERWRTSLLARSTADLLDQVRKGIVAVETHADPVLPILSFAIHSDRTDWVSELYGAEPVFRRHFDACAAKINTVDGTDPRLIVVQHSPTARLNPMDTLCAQISLGRTLIDWGLCPHSITGHGIGEWSAAAVAGLLSIEDAISGAASWVREEMKPPSRSPALADAVAALVPRTPKFAWIPRQRHGPDSLPQSGVPDLRWAETLDGGTENPKSIPDYSVDRPVLQIGRELCVLPHYKHHSPTRLRKHERAYASFLNLLRTAWTLGAALDWTSFFGHEKRSRVKLPSAALERSRFCPPALAHPNPIREKSLDIVARQPDALVGVADLAMNTETHLVKLMEEVLGIDDVQPNDDFFDLGGCSLTAVDLLSRIKSSLKVSLSLRELLDCPNARSIANLLRLLPRSFAKDASVRTCGSSALSRSVHQGTIPAQAFRALQPSNDVSMSVFFFAGECPPADGESLYGLVIDAAKLADASNFEAVWLPERHFHKFGGMFPNPAVLAAGLATCTKRVAIRAGSVVLPLHRPVEIVEQWSVVDHLSGGRVGISVAPGFHPIDFVLDPSAFAVRRDRFWSQIESLQQLWRGQIFAGTDGLGRSANVVPLPRPLQRELPLWITASQSAESFERAGKLGANVLTALLALDQNEMKARIDLYRRHFSSAHPGRTGRVTVMVHTFLHPDHGIARKVGHDALREYLRTHLDFAAKRSEYDRVTALTGDDHEALLDHSVSRYADGRSLIGTPEECEQVIASLVQIGVDEIACLIDFGVGRDYAMQSLQEIANLHRRRPTCAVP